MKRTSFREWPCSVARSVDFLGDWWAPLIFREAFLGTTRFDDFQESLSIGRNILTQRLKRFVEEGLMTREKYQDRPERFEYRLTDKGMDFFDVIAAMLRWGDRWLDEGKGPPLAMQHLACGETVHAKMVCDHCGVDIDRNDVNFTAGPGMDSETANKFDQKIAHTMVLKPTKP